MNTSSTTLIKEFFSVTCQSLPTTRILLIGRVLLFLDLLKSSLDLGEEVRLGIAKKFNWLFCYLIDGDVYSIVLDLHMPVVKVVGSASELVWQPIFLSIMYTLSPIWQFFPHDAAVSSDIDIGGEANEDSFMFELKAFLEKEVALHEVDSVYDTMKIDNENQVNKKRKLPYEISEGMSFFA
ncbi:hypothetical protein IFM89_036461 [Coptis chinensis]|uniref:Uncharacterized protein n=1 Tax=Coptis chinensis TaxID=261450 RepID=A0A835IWS4_9MAGN|nr:hypothetical protein IFM89_036461 [Coptis chinensis]